MSLMLSYVQIAPQLIKALFVFLLFFLLLFFWGLLLFPFPRSHQSSIRGEIPNLGQPNSAQMFSFCSALL